MKKLALCTTILCFLIGSISFVHALDYQDRIYTGNPTIKNTDNNIKQAKLIERHIVNYKSKVKELQEKYDISNSSIIKENIQELDKMIYSLRVIQTHSVERDSAIDVIKSVVEGLRITNNNLKPYLKLKREQYESKLLNFNKKYSLFANNLSTKIDLLIKSLAEPMIQETKLSLNQKQILKHLIRLEEASKDLDAFNSQSFESTNEIKVYLIGIIRSIRKETLSLKKLF